MIVRCASSTSSFSLAKSPRSSSSTGVAFGMTCLLPIVVDAQADLIPAQQGVPHANGVMRARLKDVAVEAATRGGRAERQRSRLFGLALRPEPRPKARRPPTRVGARGG